MKIKGQKLCSECNKVYTSEEKGICIECQFKIYNQNLNKELKKEK